MFITPKEFVVPKDATSAPSETRTQLTGLLFLHFNERGNASNFSIVFLTNHNLVQLFIPIDCTRQIRSFVKNDLLLATKVIIYVNRNYVNLAVKFRHPNFMALRPLKCCIGPKLTPGLKNFEHGNVCFVHLLTHLNV